MWYNQFSTHIDFHPSHHFHFLLNAVQRSSSLINREKRTDRSEFRKPGQGNPHTREKSTTKANTSQSFPIDPQFGTRSHSLRVKAIHITHGLAHTPTRATGEINFQGKQANGPSCFNQVLGLPVHRSQVCVRYVQKLDTMVSARSSLNHLFNTDGSHEVIVPSIILRILKG